MNRREAMTALARSCLFAGMAPMINRGRYRLFAQSAREYSKRAIELVGRSLVIDMLSPLVLSQSRMRRLLSDPASLTPADIQRYKESGITVFHVAVGVGGREATLNVLRYVAGWNGFIAHHSDHFTRIDSPATLDAVAQSGKIGILIGVQNSEHFQTLDDVDTFFGLGQRVSQLTYNARNLIGNGSTERRDDGLSDFGVAIVERMNKVGMAVDVSHCGDRTTLDACEISKKPVLITHSNCRALNPNHPRCKTDEAITRMARTGGVMGITGVRMFVRATNPRPSSTSSTILITSRGLLESSTSALGATLISMATTICRRRNSGRCGRAIKGATPSATRLISRGSTIPNASSISPKDSSVEDIAIGTSSSSSEETSLAHSKRSGL